MNTLRSLWCAYGKQSIILLALVIVFLLSLDFWNWHESLMSWFGFPLWIWYEVFLTLLLIPIYLIIINWLWRETEE